LSFESGNHKRPIGSATTRLFLPFIYAFTVNVAALQMDLVWEDKPANFSRVREMLAANPVPPGCLVALPEMFATGFSMNPVRVAEPVGGATGQFLSDLASEFRICLVAGAAVREADGRPRNKALVFSPDGQL
jgi:omega-amidase